MQAVAPWGFDWWQAVSSAGTFARASSAWECVADEMLGATGDEGPPYGWLPLGSTFENILLRVVGYLVLRGTIVNRT